MNLRHTSLLSFFKVMEKLRLEPKWFQLSRSNSSLILVLVWMTLVLEKLAGFKINLKFLNIYIHIHTNRHLHIHTPLNTNTYKYIHTYMYTLAKYVIQRESVMSFHRTYNKKIQ